MTADEIEAIHARVGNWDQTARDLGCSTDELRARRRELGAVVRRPKLRISDAELLGAYEKHGTYLETATAVGMSLGGSFTKRLQRIMADVR